MLDIVELRSQVDHRLVLNTGDEDAQVIKELLDRLQKYKTCRRTLRSIKRLLRAAELVSATA